jgi:hypothetical protein
MTFGRKNNIVRRPVRPDGGFHRLKRRKQLDHPMSVSGAMSVLRSLVHVFSTMMGGKRR